MSDNIFDLLFLKSTAPIYHSVMLYTMHIFHTCDLGIRAGWIWDDDDRIWWSCEWIGRRKGVILCRREYHAKVAMIAASQGSWDITRVGF